MACAAHLDHSVVEPISNQMNNLFVLHFFKSQDVLPWHFNTIRRMLANFRLLSTFVSTRQTSTGVVKHVKYTCIRFESRVFWVVISTDVVTPLVCFHNAFVLYKSKAIIIKGNDSSGLPTACLRKVKPLVTKFLNWRLAPAAEFCRTLAERSACCSFCLFSGTWTICLADTAVSAHVWHSLPFILCQYAVLHVCLCVLVVKTNIPLGQINLI